MNKNINQEAAAPEQEPAIWISPSNLELVQRGVRLGGCQVSPRRDADEGLTAALYTHADPSEIERLRAELKEADRRAEDYGLDACNARAERDDATQRADAAERKLAEAQALLRDWLNTPLGASSPAINRLKCKTDYMFATAQPAEVKS